MSAQALARQRTLREAISLAPRLQPGDYGGRIKKEPFERFVLAMDQKKPLETVHELFQRIFITGLKPRC